MDTGKLIDAANIQAARYDGDDRQDIKTDVMNAFYAGAKFGVLAEREACAKMVDHILKEGGGTYGDAMRKRSNQI